MRISWFEKEFMEQQGWPILYSPAFSEKDISADRKKVVDIIYNRMMELREEWTDVSVLMPENSTRKHANVFYEAFNRFFGTYPSSEAIGITVIALVSNIVPKNVGDIKRLLLYVRDHFTSDSRIIISTVAAGIGSLMVIVRILRMIVMFPKWIVVHVQRIVRRF